LGDTLLVMGSLLEKFAGKIDLIYIAPPFATEADFSFTTEIGDSELEVTKEQSIIEEKAYRDTWGGGLASYMEMTIPGKPRSSKQRYRTTDLGLKVLSKWKEEK